MTTYRVAGRRSGGPGVLELTLVPDDGAQPAPYVPGSHLPVRAGGVVNAYSLLDDGCRPSAYRIGVRRGCPGGGSAWLHDNARTGTTLVAGPPRSAFAPVLSARSHLLLGAGIGVTPLLSHLRAARRWGRQVELVVGSGAGRDVFASELDDLAPPRTTRVVGRAALRAAVREALSRQPIGTHAYACGPDGFAAEVRSAAADLAWPAGRLHIEHFDAPQLDAGDPFTAELGDTGRELHVPAGTSLLHALDAAGVRLDRMCERGVCGRCEVGVRSGDIRHRDLVLGPADRARGDVMLACVSRGSTTLRLEVP
ncbi:PDR/VanB family oxidoreductase [Actinoplanes sp. M2I2]|uniref:PDR/VanB family oxidoreductase n=1 Tax=Actinoplanes sp. M2I2 TaxID=1734444 RepID=UPI002021F3F0|nr:PDR/VanB family oxidoreductase [Actinoplanes sp. M2I2]